MDVNGNSRKGWLYSDETGKVRFVKDNGGSINTLIELGFSRKELLYSLIPEVFTTPSHFKRLIKDYR